MKVYCNFIRKLERAGAVSDLQRSRRPIISNVKLGKIET